MKPRLFSYVVSSGYLWLVPVAAYLAFSATQAVARNYSSEKQTRALETQLNAARLERERLAAVIVYYRTDNFKEKELRRALLLVRPEEKVYALPESSSVRSLEEEASSVQSDADKARRNESDLPYWRQWVGYVLKG